MNTYHLAPTLSPAPRILIIEDDVELCTHLSNHLSRRGFALNSTQCGDQGLDLALHSPVELILLDIMLPNESGLNILARLRHARGTPVILMSALGAEADRISGFQRGADDYLPKPFSMVELRVRIEAILRRVALDRRPLPTLAPVREDTRTLRFDDELCDVFHQERWAGLTRSEYRLLETLHRNAEEVLSKAFLYQHVLQRGYAPHDRSLDMHISQIRRKLKAIGYTEREVRTVWGKGYVLSGHDDGL
ncbi:MAG TPA: DNA-binding response regulator [Pseudomonas sp.]|nr:DNA-binding response regulator [Pseudomonas sp.]